MVTKIMLGKIEAEVVLKDIKNVHLSVHPPAGRVRIAAPQADEARHDSGVRHLETRLDQKAAKKAPRPGT